MLTPTTIRLTFGFLLAVLGAAMPTSLISTSTTVNIANTNINRDANPNANVTWQVRAQTFTEDYCGGAYTFLWLDADVCVDFAAGVKSLRVVGYDGPVRDNSLNVYSALNCHSGLNLQPVLSRSCFQTVGGKSIKLKTYG